MVGNVKINASGGARVTGCETEARTSGLNELRKLRNEVLAGADHARAKKEFRIVTRDGTTFLQLRNLPTKFTAVFKSTNERRTEERNAAKDHVLGVLGRSGVPQGTVDKLRAMNVDRQAGASVFFAKVDKVITDFDAESGSVRDTLDRGYERLASQLVQFDGPLQNKMSKAYASFRDDPTTLPMLRQEWRKAADPSEGGSKTRAEKRIHELVLEVLNKAHLDHTIENPQDYSQQDREKLAAKINGRWGFTAKEALTLLTADQMKERIQRILSPAA